jgi:hypothetical protein
MHRGKGLAEKEINLRKLHKSAKQYTTKKKTVCFKHRGIPRAKILYEG